MRLRSRRTATRLLLLVAALPVLQPLALGLTSIIVRASELVVFSLDITGSEDFGVRLFAPVAIGGALLLPHLLRSELRAETTRRSWADAWLGALVALSTIVLGVACILAQRTPWTDAQEGLTGALAQSAWSWAWWAPTLAWVIAAPLGLAAGVYWLGRTLSPRARGLFVVSLASGAILFLLQLTPLAFDALRLSFPATQHAPLSLRLVGTAWTAALGPGAVVLVAGIATLRGVQPLVRLVLPREWRRFTPRGAWLALTVLVLAWPGLVLLQRHPELADAQASTLAVVVAGLCAGFAVIAPISCLVETSAHSPFGRRQLTPGMIVLLTGVFAAYASFLSRSALVALIVGAVAWFVFRRWILASAPDGEAGPPPSAGLAEALVSTRQRLSSISARHKGFQDKYAKGEITLVRLRSEETALAAARQATEEELGGTPALAKRALLGDGPESSPLRNAALGALAGLAAAVVLQVFAPLQLLAQTDAKDPGWVGIVFSRLQLHVVNLPPDAEIPVLPSLGLLINASAVWVITGFLFGYCFHRIRGGDGFSRGAVFAAGLTTLCMMQASLSNPSRESVQAFVPLVLFLMVLGALVFDLRTLARHGVTADRLPAIYGLSTSVGYASLAGLVAGLQSLLGVLKALGR